MTTHPTIPPRPAANEAHGKRDARYLHLLDCNLFGIGVGDFNGNVLDANDALLHMFGSTREDLEAGRVRWKELTAPEYFELDERMLKQLRIDGICPPYEKEMIHRDGTRIPILLHLAVAPDDPECMVASIIDLTKQKQTEAALRLSEARFRLLVDGSQDYAFYMLDPTGHVVTWNASAERIKGFRADEIIGKHLSVFYLPEDVENGKPDRELEEARKGKIEVEGWRVRGDGTRFWAHVTTSALRDREGRLQGFAKITKDVSQRRRSDVFLASTLNNVIDGVVSISQQGSIESFNPAAERMFGYQESEVLGKNVKMLLPEPYRSQHDAYIAQYLRTGQSKILGMDVMAAGCRRDGTTFPMELAVSEFYLYDQRHFTGVVRDLTERRLLEDQLRQAQKMEAVGQLAGGVAHDFNNMLTIILGYGELVLEALPKDNPLRTAVEAMCEAGTRATNLTRQLLAFSRRAVMEPKLVDLNILIREMEKMLLRLIGEDIVLTTLLPPKLSQVLVDPSQIDQVIMNLIVNSRDAMPQGGQLTIETSDVEVDDEYARLHPGVEPGKYVKLEITDTGCGMPRDVKDHIFEPFFTTKEAGKGTGLGLATVYGIVKQSGGHIQAFSEPDYGTSFQILLPVAERSAALLNISTTTPKQDRGSETLLVVEDEEGVRNMVVHVLERQGYQVLKAANGPEAMDICQHYESPIDLLVTDVVMPQINGRQLAEILHLQFPSMKVLYMSGYTDDAVIRSGVMQAETNFLQKPFTTVVLARKVREVLDDRAAGGSLALAGAEPALT